jgi:hypothetical protein
VTLIVAGHNVPQVELDRSAPLGAEGRQLLYREIWTGVPGGRGVILFDGFWPKEDEDAAAEAEVRCGYQVIFESLEFVTPEVASRPSTLPSMGAGGASGSFPWLVPVGVASAGLLPLLQGFRVLAAGGGGRKRAAGSPFKTYRAYPRRLAGRGPDELVGEMRGR